MTYSAIAARVAIGSAALALAALAALHLLKPDLHPSRTMISQYALGRFGWVMAVCFAVFGVGSASLFVALMPHAPSLLARIGLAFLLIAAVGLVMAARFPMDPVSTSPAQMSSKYSISVPPLSARVRGRDGPGSFARIAIGSGWRGSKTGVPR